MRREEWGGGQRRSRVSVTHIILHVKGEMTSHTETMEKMNRRMLQREGGGERREERGERREMGGE